MKKKVSYLSPTEFAFMKQIWNAERPLSVAEILERRTEEKWAKNSIHPLINSLLEKGFLAVNGVVKATKANSRLYEGAISLEDYVSWQMEEVFGQDMAKLRLKAVAGNLGL